jgi:hypothetical protein
VTLQLIVRCLLLAMGFALTTFGLTQWQSRMFSLHDLWPFAEAFVLHPAHVLLLGVAMIPPALWEIFLLDHVRHDHRE